MIMLLPDLERLRIQGSKHFRSSTILKNPLDNPANCERNLPTGTVILFFSYDKKKTLPSENRKKRNKKRVSRATIASKRDRLRKCKEFDKNMQQRRADSKAKRKRRRRQKDWNQDNWSRFTYSKRKCGKRFGKSKEKEIRKEKEKGKKM